MSDSAVEASTQAERLADSIADKVLSGEFLPGFRLDESALAERFGVSRVPLREALKILEGEGSVTYVPHRGYFVAELSLVDLREVYRIRELLEAEAVTVAMPLLTDSDVERFGDALADCERAGEHGDVIAMTEANRRLHFTLYAAAGLPRLERMVRVLWDATDVYRSLYYGDAGNRADVRAEHREIYAAVRARDTGRVVALLDAHRAHAVEHISGVLARYEASSG